ncbi:MAG: hypothetical protein RI973_1058 [Bacteroidota bacterium]|jgi:hypothetical protein
MKSYLFSICLLLLASHLQAQYLEAGFFTGFTNYQGDLAEAPIEIGATSLSFGGFLRYGVSPRFKARVSGYYGLISGSDLNAVGSRRQRGWSFTSTLVELSAVAEFHPLGKNRFSSGGVFRANASPYVASGLGIVITDPKVRVTNPADAARFPEPGLDKTAPSIPFIVGIRLDAYEFVSLGFEYGWRLAFSDDLDGVNKEGKSNRDLYMLLGASFSYVF